MITFVNVTPHKVTLKSEGDSFVLNQDVNVELEYATYYDKPFIFVNNDAQRELHDWTFKSMNLDITPEEYVEKKLTYFVYVLAAHQDDLFMQISDHDHFHEDNKEEDGLKSDHDEFLSTVKTFPLIDDHTNSGIIHKIGDWLGGLKDKIFGAVKSPIEQAEDIFFKIYDSSIFPIASLHIDEATALKNRKEKIAKFLCDNYGLDVDADSTPSIALTFSGGGMRALMSCASSIDVMKRNDLLDVMSYISCLSGSTWAVAPWMLRSAKDGYNVFYPKGDEDYYKFGNKIPDGVKPTTAHMTNVEKMQFLKNIYYYYSDKRGSITGKQTLTHIWGILVGAGLLRHREKDDKKFSDYILEDLKEAVNDGDNPIPIFTASFNKYDYYGNDHTNLLDQSNDKFTKNSQELGWISMSPYTSGSEIMEKMIESKHFGNLYETIPLYRLIGIWGSAFTGCLEDMGLGDVVTKAIESVSKGDASVHSIAGFAEKFFNFSPIKDMNEIEIRDGGLRCNVPLYPLFAEKRRKCEISVVFDASSEMREHCGDCIESLKESVLAGYSEHWDKITDTVKVRIVRSPIGHVIYFPVDMGAFFNKGEYASTNLNYTEKQFDGVYDVVEKLVSSVYTLPNGDKKKGVDIIKDEIRDVTNNGLTKEVEVIELVVPFDFPNPTPNPPNKKEE